MKLRTFTLRFDEVAGRFDDDELVQFMHGHEVLTVYEHMVHAAGEPVWAILVGYKAPRTAASPQAPRAAPEEDGVEVDEADRPLYEALRRWRNDQARKTGRPAYVIMYN